MDVIKKDSGAMQNGQSPSTKGRLRPGEAMSLGSPSGEEVSIKRRRMIKCLEEIQTLVDLEIGHGDDATLSTLQAVVDQIKQLKAPVVNECDGNITEGTEEPETSHNQTSLSEAAFHPVDISDIDTGFCEDPCASEQVFHNTGEFRIVVSCSTRKIKEASEDVLSFLGFNQSELIGQPFNRLIHEKDILTFATSVSSLDLVNVSESQADSVVNKTVSFYMRLLHNKARSWYNRTSHPSRYSVMFSRVHVQQLDNGNIGSDSCRSSGNTFAQESSSDTCSSRHGAWDTSSGSHLVDHHQSDIQNLANSVHKAFHNSAHLASLSPDIERSLYYVINCSPIQSSYKIRDQVPKQQCFSYKHSPGGIYTYIDPTAISLIGYLPQDLVGTSIFQYYHPEDYAILLSAYQSLRAKPLKTTQICQPIRYRVRNGEFVIVDAELSCFVNPWSQKLDFVIGKHIVVRGPRNMDVFAEYGSRKLLTDMFPEKQPEHRKAQNDILQLLTQRIDESCVKEGKEPKQNVRKLEQKSDESSSNPIDEGQSSPKTDSSKGNKGRKSADESHEGELSNIYSVNSSSSISQWDQEEINKVYNSLAYLQGIQRLLASQFGPEESGMRIQIPATDTQMFDNNMTWTDRMSTSADLETVSEDGSGFPHPPSQPASSTKAMLLEDDMQMLSPREPDREVAQHSENENQPMPRVPSLSVVSEDSQTTNEPELHVHKLTFENLQLHQQYQRNNYLRTLLKDNQMKLFYETLSVPKLMRNLRHRLRKRRKNVDSPDSNTNEIAMKLMKCAAHDDNVPLPADFPITSIEDAKACRDGPVHAEQAARPQPQQVSASLLHAHHPLHIANFANTVPAAVLPAAPLYGYSKGTPFRYGLSKSSPFQKPSTPLLAQSQFGYSAKNHSPNSPTVPSPWSSFQSPLTVLQQKTAVQDPDHSTPVTDPLSIKIPIEKQVTTKQMGCIDEDSTTSSIGVLDSSYTDNSCASVSDERRARCPFWLEDLHPSVGKEQIFNYEVDLSCKDDLEVFCTDFTARPQAPELYQQLLEFELGKLDLDLEEDSDNSSLFTPLKAEAVEQQWFSKTPTNSARMQQVPFDPYTDTDSSGFVNTAILLQQKKRKPRSARNQSVSATNAKQTLQTSTLVSTSTEGSVKSSGKSGAKNKSKAKPIRTKSLEEIAEENVVKVLAQQDEQLSVESMDCKSNTSNNDSDNSGVKSESTKSDSSKDISSKNSSSTGYQGSAEMTSSNGDVYSIDDCHDYLDSNREFCKTYNKETLMEYRVNLTHKENPTILLEACHKEQPSLIYEQLDELVREFSVPSADESMESLVSPTALSQLEPEANTQESGPKHLTRTVYAKDMEEVVAQGAAQLKSKSEFSSQHDSGFQSGSTYDIDRQRNLGSGSSSQVISSTEKSSASSNQGSGEGSSANNASSNSSEVNSSDRSSGGNSSGGNSSGASNIQSGGSGSDTNGGASSDASNIQSGLSGSEINGGGGSGSENNGCGGSDNNGGMDHKDLSTESDMDASSGNDTTNRCLGNIANAQHENVSGHSRNVSSSHSSIQESVISIEGQSLRQERNDKNLHRVSEHSDVVKDKASQGNVVFYLGTIGTQNNDTATQRMDTVISHNTVADSSKSKFSKAPNYSGADNIKASDGCHSSSSVVNNSSISQIRQQMVTNNDRVESNVYQDNNDVKIQASTSGGDRSSVQRENERKATTNQERKFSGGNLEGFVGLEHLDTDVDLQAVVDASLAAPPSEIFDEEDLFNLL